MLSKNLTVLTITITKAKNEAEIVQDTSRITPRLMAEIQTNQGGLYWERKHMCRSTPYLKIKVNFFMEKRIFTSDSNNY
jgi:hypothetical protein